MSTPVLPPKKPQLQTLTAVALYSFKPTEPDELPFSEGDVITVLERYEDTEWWKGELKGRVGLFPSNFCRVDSKMAPKLVPKPVSAVVPAATPSSMQSNPFIMQNTSPKPKPSPAVTAVKTPSPSTPNGTSSTIGNSGGIARSLSPVHQPTASSSPSKLPDPPASPKTVSPNPTPVQSSNVQPPPPSTPKSVPPNTPSPVSSQATVPKPAVVNPIPVQSVPLSSSQQLSTPSKTAKTSSTPISADQDIDLSDIDHIKPRRQGSAVSLDEDDDDDTDVTDESDTSGVEVDVELNEGEGKQTFKSKMKAKLAKAKAKAIEVSKEAKKNAVGKLVAHGIFNFRLLQSLLILLSKRVWNFRTKLKRLGRRPKLLRKSTRRMPARP